MKYSTTKTYTLKRSIIEFGRRIFKGLSRPGQKFGVDMIYGMLAAKTCLLTSIVDQLHERTRKVNAVERLGRHLCEGIPEEARDEYHKIIQEWVPDNPVILIDDSDVVKPEGRKFEALGIVRDGSKSTEKKNVYEKGYHVTEAVAITRSKQPVSLYSRIHSSQEKGYISANAVTFEAIDQCVGLFRKATYVMDRGYDDNKVFLKLEGSKQDYVIRLTSKRKVLYHGKWTPVTELRDRRKGKIKMKLHYHDMDHEAYLSHVKVMITASRKPIWLVLVYGITEHPMMLATNIQIRSKDDVIRVAKLYFSRWGIEEYFRCKKPVFEFENFRVRSLKAINALNFYMPICMAYLAFLSLKPQTNQIVCNVIEAADPIKKNVCFLGYRYASGIARILGFAHEGCRGWFKPTRVKYCQLSFL